MIGPIIALAFLVVLGLVALMYCIPISFIIIFCAFCIIALAVMVTSWLTKYHTYKPNACEPIKDSPYSYIMNEEKLPYIKASKI